MTSDSKFKAPLDPRFRGRFSKRRDCVRVAEHIVCPAKPWPRPIAELPETIKRHRQAVHDGDGLAQHSPAEIAADTALAHGDSVGWREKEPKQNRAWGSSVLPELGSLSGSRMSGRENEL